MTIRAILIAGVFATGAAFSAAAEPAQSGDNDCDEIMGELEELLEEVVKQKAGARSPLATCAATGQVLGVAKSSLEVASECYEAGQKRESLVAKLEKIVKETEGQIGSQCK